MTRGTWNPFEALLAEYAPRPEGFVPRVEVKETKDALVLKADLPGIQTGELDVSVQANVLSISGKRERERRTDDVHVHLVERRFGAFSRSFQLPEGMDTNALAAELKDGVLTVTLPKAPEAKPHKVQIKQG